MLAGGERDDDEWRAMMPTRIDEHGIIVNVRYASDMSPRYKEITRKRRIVREAFDNIRNSPQERLMVDMLAKVLGGKLDLTGDVLATAEAILSRRRS